DLAAAKLHATGDGFVRTRIDRLPRLAVIGGAERIAAHAEHHHAAILHAEAAPIGAFILRLNALEALTGIGGAIDDAKLGGDIEIAIIGGEELVQMEVIKNALAERTLFPGFA